MDFSKILSPLPTPLRLRGASSWWQGIPTMSARRTTTTSSDSGEQKGWQDTWSARKASTRRKFVRYPTERAGRLPTTTHRAGGEQTAEWKFSYTKRRSLPGADPPIVEGQLAAHRAQIYDAAPSLPAHRGQHQLGHRDQSERRWSRIGGECRSSARRRRPRLWHWSAPALLVECDQLSCVIPVGPRP